MQSFNIRAAILTVAILFVTAFGVNAQSYYRNGRIPADLKITLVRGVCFGRCPAYELTIDSRGNVRFNGKHFTRVEGAARDKIRRAQVREILREFDTAEFRALRPNYNTPAVCGGLATDLPSETITITARGRTKTVHHYYGCLGKRVRDELKRLSTLGKKIDDLTGSEKWVKETR